MSGGAVSFRHLSQREEVLDSEDEEDRKPRYNPFSDEGNFDFIDPGFSWVSKEEVADFMKQSRGLSFSDAGADDDDAELGEAWGGTQFSITSGKPRSDSSAQSARTRPQPSTASSSVNANKLNTAVGSAKTPPKRPPLPASVSRPSANTSTTSMSALSTSSSSSSSTSHVSAAAVRERTAKLPTTQASLQSVSSSISEVISNTPQVSVTEYHKLQAEIQQLKRDLQLARKDKTAVPTVQETVKKIILGQPYTLEVYKSLQDKLSLLDSAIKMHDGNAITAAVLFLRKTVRPGILRDELRTRPKAVDHLSKYLKEHFDYTELTELYRSVGEYEKAAMLQFNQAVKSKDPGVRLTKLKYILRHHFEGYPQLSEQTNYLNEYIELLEQQLLIEEADSKAEIAGKNQVMVAHPRQASLPLCSLIVTLYYCCRYHFGEPENTFTSPLAIRSKFKLSDKQYEWTALSSRAKLKQWRGLEQMFTVKGFFGAVKMKSVIGFKQVVELLHQHGVPEEVLNTYLKLITDTNERLSLATKLKCHNMAIETLVAMKDRQQLNKYRSNLRGTAPEQAKITEYLNNSQMRWKN